jgi:glycosyltransferase involved in cell wall biosynthesis
MFLGKWRLLLWPADQMKILYHHRTASRDGQSTHIDEMIGGLRAEGHSVVESSPQVGSDNAKGGSPGWVGRLKNLLPRQIYELAELAYSVAAYRKLAGAIKRDRPDGIYERYNLYLLAGVWAKKRFGLPLILEVNAPMALERRQYGGLSWPRLADWAELYVWRQADVILPVTKVLADYMIARGIELQRITVIPNAINEDHYRNLPSAAQAKEKLGLSGRLVVGFTGFVREWDRLDRIMAWVAMRAAQYNTHLLVIGDGPARAEIEACAVNLGVTDRLSFTGAVPREQVPGLSMAFDIALQTALVPYASPLCLFEYLALGKAIVAPDQPNHHEILSAGIDAMLYGPDDPSGIEKALDALCQDSILRSRIANNAPDLIVKKQLTWRQHARKVVALFERIDTADAARDRQAV